ncbi:MAG TPA: hydantoinase/oxoprolinase family protein [Alphaproteobacteria bacterium]|nr:hydantoinase/oxoprolinase family protein [Alphaproteobacteria bacterium]
MDGRQGPAAPRMRIAADVGGTFTDVAAFDEKSGALRLGKALTTPGRLVDGIEIGVSRAGSSFDAASLFLHGTTVAINTMLERTGARTALVITAGFRDIYEIGRVNRPESYNLYFRKHRPLVPRALRFEVNERVMANGEVLLPLDEAELERLVPVLRREKVEALAILFLHSYRNPDHEIRAKRFFEQRCPDLFITVSHELSQEYREFERVSTTAANAYVGPRVSRYLGEIDGHLEKTGFPGTFLVVQSTGGLYDGDRARLECIRMLESGPAAGVIGTKALCEAIDLPSAIAFDMGGTTAKAGVIHDGRVLITGSAMVGGYNEGLPIQIPMIDIQEVGTGGGSIAYVVAGGALRVGPESAGAAPGPACYGLGGTKPTVTDANLVLGRLSAEQFLGGDMKLDMAAAEDALRRDIADPLGLEAHRAADGIVRVAAASMSNVVRRVTTERGLDARDFAMVAYGGAGPLHAALVARELRIGRLIIPNAPGHFSAFGMLLADLRRDYVRTLFTRLHDLDFAATEAIFRAMEEEGTRSVRDAAPDVSAVQLLRGADMRYVGQEHAVSVDIPREHFLKRDLAAIKRCFDEEHRVRYGFASETELAEIVSLRCSVNGVMAKPPLRYIAAGGSVPPDAALRAKRPVFFTDRGFVETPAYDRARLEAGNRIAGPALVEEYASTTVVLPGDTLEVDPYGNLVITVRSQ